MHDQAYAGIAEQARQLEPQLNPQELGGLAAAIRAFHDDPAKAHRLLDELTKIYATNPAAKKILSTPEAKQRVAAVGQVASSYRSPRRDQTFAKWWRQ